MAWPTPQEYNEAVQNPAQSFADPELAGGVPQVTALGLPRPITGNFASVYRLRCGRSDWAVRCFFREYADMRERYAAISRHLAARPLPYTVGFQYLEQGIMVRGSWYPILKMEWVEGELLGDFVERHLSDGRLLARLAERWLVMLRELEGACIAHGDLQHGNVMVVAGELRLVDYDGMFVPALDGRTSHEIGHPNYQHPSRSGSDFGAHLDRFSAWVIYLSLQALSRDPSLWQRTGAGDECLLFRRADFERPQASAIVPLLTHHGDAEIRALAGRFVAALSARLDRIERVAPPAAPVRGQRGAGGRYGLKWRLTQALAPSVSPGATSRTEAPETSAIPEWLRDALPAEPERSHFAARSSLPLLPLIASTVVLALAAAPVLLQYLSVAATVASLLTAALSVGTASCLVAYRRQPSVRALRAVRRREVAQRGRIGRLERRIARRLGREVGERNRLERAVKRAADRRTSDEERVQRLAERAGATAREMQALCDAALHRLDERERASLEAALAELKGRHVRSYLRGESIRGAAIPDVSIWLTARLWLRGVRSAADLDGDRIPSLRTIGERPHMALVAWRVEMERAARRSLPRSLPAPRRERVTRRLEAGKRRIAADHQRIDVELAALVEAIHAQSEGIEARYGAAVSRAESRFALASEGIKEEVTELERTLRAAHRQLAAIEAELSPFAGITFRRFLAEAVPGSQLRRRRPSLAQ